MSGFRCWQYDDCHNDIETPFEDGPKADRYAAERGWVIGHFDGQGQIACPDCRDTVWDALPLYIPLFPEPPLVMQSEDAPK